MLTGSRANIKVSIRGNQTIGLGSNGSILNIGANQTVILRGPTLKGRSGNGPAVVTINEGEFRMYTGSMMSGGAITKNAGVGVAIFHGAFTMSGGEISENRCTATAGGGGVSITAAIASFEMRGAALSTIPGGGIRSVSAAADIYAGEISGNKAEGPNNYGGGGTIIIDNNTVAGATQDADAPISGNMRCTWGVLKGDSTPIPPGGWTQSNITVPPTGTGGWAFSRDTAGG